MAEARLQEQRERTGGDRNGRTNAPEGPSELQARGWWAVLKRTVKEFREDDLTDWAAALTYYTVLSIFPALIALVSILGLAGQNPQTTNALLDIVDEIGPSSAVDTLRGPIESLITNKSGAGRRAGDRAGSRALVGLQLRRRVHASVERDLRARGRPPLLEAPARPSLS